MIGVGFVRPIIFMCHSDGAKSSDDAVLNGIVIIIKYFGYYLLGIRNEDVLAGVIG